MSHDAPFSPSARAGHLRALRGRRFDLLVVGGGITGAGVALDAATRGLEVALVEAGDVAEGTSSRSSRLIHGGLRYLETGDFRLVFEALAERRRLLELASHLVRPLPFLFPLYRSGPIPYRKLQAGMWLYDLLSLFRGVRRHRMLRHRAVLAAEPKLLREGLVGGAEYFDASVDDARLTLAVARGAHHAGAAVVPHAAVTGFVRDGEGTVRGARVRDALTGEEVEARADVVVNATGPWSDELRRLADPGAAPRLRPTKGVHVVLDRERVGNEGALIFPSPVDGRTMFVLPWGAFTYVGTTDTDFDGSPGDAEATEADVEYLLRSADALFPEARLTPADVLSTWTGVRPLLAPERGGEGVPESATSREHEIWRDPGGLVTVAGGKLTTYRVMAAETVDFAVELLRREGEVEAVDSITAELHLPGAPIEPWETFVAGFRRAAEAAGLGAATAEHLARAYGEDAEAVLAAIRAEPELGTPILPELPYLWAEVPHAVEHEMALTLEDVLRRRLHLFYEARDGGMRVAGEVAARMAAVPGLGWDAAEAARQVEAYRAAVEATRPPPPD
ncbi:MAG TPA: glycerol-3-phosphate dehydrogenase/oxidase [Longimicrobiaceae bacterium]|nr:glycerol-3-phosphate dehydrogenase/oxidase [Longimicrobiaceae bacterium]